MKHLLLALAALCLPGVAQASEVQRIANGVVVTPDAGGAKRVRVLVYGPGRFRVTEVPGDSLDILPSLQVTAQPGGDFTVEESAGSVTVKTAGGSAEIARKDGHVAFRDAAGKPMLAESGKTALVPTEVEGTPWYRTSVQFNAGTDEGFYGLGQHQNRQMNYNGEDVELAQHNMDIAVPFLVSTRNYGLLWDNSSITRFGNPRPYEHVGKDLKVTSGGKAGWKAEYYLGDALAVARQEAFIDYQFIKDQANWPAEVKGKPGLRVVWTGDVTAANNGIHKFRLYGSSYMKLWVDGKPVIDAWRQNWNPWFRNFDLPMKAGKPVSIRIEWEPNGGYLAFFHNDPLPAADRHSLWLSSEAGQAIDYYVVTGVDADGVIAGYRALTGKAEMMPRWAYGFWQSRQRYETQEQLLGVLREYRKRRIPLDTIVQDWFYWPEDSWGCQCFDKKRFPDPKGMVDEVHALNAHIMISVWGKFYPTTGNAKALDAKGWLYRRPLEAGQKDWVGPGYPNTFYDPYPKGARDLYFSQVKPMVDLGFDAWWLDSVEPDWHSNLSIAERAWQMGPTERGPGAAVFNTYPLVHVDGFAEHLRKAEPDQRPFILTRSGFGGTQRASAAVWSGDVGSRWSDLRDQISAGVNLSMSGIPNWTHDIGGFALEDRYTKQDPAHVEEWRELNLRWFQFGAFSPLFRSHGESPKREIYEIAAGDPAMYDAMVAYDRLRYRLMPTIYTLGADTWMKDGTIMRGLVMDFPNDRKAWAIDDEYMFGPSFLVAPVTEFRARSRQVYLPAGPGWYDFRSGKFYKGGQTIVADAPREWMPLFVRAGSIVVTGPEVQYAGEQPDGPLIVHVYTGADASFSLYEDDGISPGYKQGKYARIPMTWNEKDHDFSVGAREGGYPGMPGKRAVAVHVYRPDAAEPPDFGEGGTTFVYDGKEYGFVQLQPIR